NCPSRFAPLQGARGFLMLWRPLSAQARAPSRPSGAAKQKEPAENEGGSRPGIGERSDAVLWTATVGPRSDRADIVARRHCQKVPRARPSQGGGNGLTAR